MWPSLPRGASGENAPNRGCLNPPRAFLSEPLAEKAASILAGMDNSMTHRAKTAINRDMVREWEGRFNKLRGLRENFDFGCKSPVEMHSKLWV